MKTKTLRSIRDKLPSDLFYGIPVLEKGLKNYTLEELLDEVVERGRFWNHCAIGERFSVPKDKKTSAIEEMESEGLTPHEASVLLKEGMDFMDFLYKARRSYRRIQKVRPTLQIPYKEEEATILERKPE